MRFWIGRSSLVGLGLLVIGATSAAAQPSPLWGDLEPGPYRVGFQVLYRLDGTRTYFARSIDEDEQASAVQGRPIRIMVWYPASERGGTEPMRFGDYLSMDPRSSHFAGWNRVLQARDLDTARRQFAHSNPDSLLDILTGAVTAAYLDVPAAQGSFPLVLHSLGRNDFQMESTVLWEYLASHGYVVATVPQLGVNPLKSRLSFTIPDLELQLTDLAFALNELRRFRTADTERVAAMGHSSGGIVAMMLAATNRNVEAVVGLDPSFVTHDGNELLFSWEGFDLGRIRVPILTMYSAFSPERVSFTVLDTLLYSDRVNLGWAKATHFDFQNWPLYSPLTGTEDPRGLEFRDVNTGKEIHLTICRETERFLWTVFNGTEEEMAALGAASELEELPDSLPAATFQPGRHVPFPEDIAQLYLDGDSQAAVAVVHQVRERYPEERVFTNWEINALHDQLESVGKDHEALELLRLGVELDTASVVRRYLLAEALLDAEKAGEAVAQYQAILEMTADLELDPDSTEARVRTRARERLSELGWEPEPEAEEPSETEEDG
jgi:pimeloyl-ACP methyl ester carboxylesterase